MNNLSWEYGRHCHGYWLNKEIQVGRVSHSDRAMRSPMSGYLATIWKPGCKESIVLIEKTFIKKKLREAKKWVENQIKEIYKINK